MSSTIPWPFRQYNTSRVMSTYPNIPPWLLSSSSPKHVEQALHMLKKREIIRRRARELSRHELLPYPSVGHEFILWKHLFQSRQNAKQGGQNTEEFYSVSIANRPCNLSHNRYGDVEPYDRTRTIVPGGEGEGRYLNASWVLERFGRKWWIASQAPLPISCHAFLSLILQQNVQPPKSSNNGLYKSRIRTVVQLTQHVERGIVKANHYFPEEVGRSWHVPPEPGCSAPPLQVMLVDLEYIKEAQCMCSTVSVTSPLNPRGTTFTHLLYTAWPDHGIPGASNQQSLFSFIQLVDQTNREVPLSEADPEILDPDPPVIVGCSAGIGRTGSFIALCSLLRDCGILSPPASPASPDILDVPPMDPLPRELEEDKVVQEIDSLREQRPGMVQRDEQALLIYQMLVQQYAGSG